MNHFQRTPLLNKYSIHPGSTRANGLCEGELTVFKS